MTTSSKNIRHVLIGGAKGVGKTTLVSSPSIQNKFKTIIFSNLLKFSAREIFGKNFIKLNMKERDILRKLVAENIIKDKTLGIFIWEVHFCCYEFGRKRSVIPENLLKVSSSIIFLTLGQKTLEQRRLNDKTKRRSYSPKTILRDSGIELEYAKKASKKFNIPLFLYKNDASADGIDEILAKIIK